MATIQSISLVSPAFKVQQEEAKAFTRTLFSNDFKDIDRLLRVFQNGDIHTRHVCMPLEWYGEDHSFEEKNACYTAHAIQLGTQAIEACLSNTNFLDNPVDYDMIDAIFFVSSTGIATPSIEARLMNTLPFREDVKRIPLWGLGCAGGAAGMSRAYEYCLAYPQANVLVLTVELCSLTFQKNDRTKSNLIGISLFADGVACALLSGKQSIIQSAKAKPTIIATNSKLLPKSEDVMGWDVKDSGLYVIFSKNIPSIITTWLGPFVHQFLEKQLLTTDDITHFIAHPGGKKVLRAYEDALQFDHTKTATARSILQSYGNMSSPTVLYVLEQFMHTSPASNDYGLMAALGPGFSGELLLLQWK